jgi:hypothetical protein
MKKLILLGFLFVGTLSACTLSQRIEVTGQPIGSKTGVAKTGFLVGNDASLKAAAANGNISTIGAWERTTKFFIVTWTVTKVYGN